MQKPLPPEKPPLILPNIPPKPPKPRTVPRWANPKDYYREILWRVRTKLGIPTQQLALRSRVADSHLPNWLCGGPIDTTIIRDDSLSRAKKLMDRFCDLCVCFIAR